MQCPSCHSFDLRKNAITEANNVTSVKSVVSKKTKHGSGLP
jgi:hypothetical protein